MFSIWKRLLVVLALLVAGSLLRQLLDAKEESVVDQEEEKDDSRLRILFAFVTFADGSKQRAILRSTWLNGRDVNTTRFAIDWRFFIPSPAANETLLKEVLQENERYNDLVFLPACATAIDEFNQLLHRIGLSLEWICQKRLKPDIVIKVDADAFVHLPRLTEYLEGLNLNRTKHYYIGRKFGYSDVRRDKDQKFWVTKADYPFSKYPEYMQGGCYGLTRALSCEVGRLIVHEPCFDMNNGLEDAMVGVAVEALRQQSWEINFVETPSSWEGLFNWNYHWPYQIMVLHKLQGEDVFRLLYNHTVVNNLDTSPEHLVECIASSPRLHNALPPIALFPDPTDHKRLCWFKLPVASLPTAPWHAEFNLPETCYNTTSNGDRFNYHLIELLERNSNLGYIN